MKRLGLPLLACTLLLCRAGAADPAPIVDVARDPAWRDLLGPLAPTRARESSFEERRYFPFRRDPILLTGEIRILPSRGLSLGYLTPEPRVLIADSKGLLLRDASGHDRALPDDARAQAATAALAGVLRFDLPELEKSFELRGRHDGAAWTLSLSARDRTLAGALGTLVLTGDRGRLLRIEMIRSASQRIEIRIGEPREDVTFSAETLDRFFR